jgi:hypothetical protein
VSEYNEVKVDEPKVVQEVAKQEENKVEVEDYQTRVANVKDSKLAKGLTEMAEIGYSNFDLNVQLLTRNSYDVVVAINKLCNGLLTESMFE